MWGNRLGWMISAGITAATVVLYAVLLFGPSISSPTSLTTSAGALDAIALPGSPRTLVPASGSDDGTDLYQQAMDQYAANKDAFDHYAINGKLKSEQYDTIIPAIDLLVQAADQPKATIFSKSPEKVVCYNPNQARALAPIEKLGRIALRIGIQENAAKDADDAKKYLKAAYVLGYVMCNERLIYHELRIGQDLMRSAAINLGTIDKDKGDDFKAIDPEYKTFMEGQQKFIDLCNPSNDASIATNTGDVFNLAQNSQERMWRDEAIMMLGHLRYNASQPGDQRGAVTVLDKISATPGLDPAVAAAVKVASDLTIEDHRTSQQLPSD